MSHHKDSTSPSPTRVRSAGVYEHTTAERLTRALGTLEHTASTTGVDWLERTCRAKVREARAHLKLASCGYRVRFDRTDPRRVY